MVEGGTFAFRISTNQRAAARLRLKGLNVQFIFYASIAVMVIQATRKIVRDSCYRSYVQLTLS